ncbi:PKHB1 protein, partial [Panurus biarmicus]|nr:PKHB1 protein [Panurus biarmicus]
DVQPPEGRSRDCLLTVVLRDGSKTMLCAESEDDAVAWKMAVLEAKSTPVRLRPPEQGHHPGTGFGSQDLGWERLPQPCSSPGLTLSLGGSPTPTVQPQGTGSKVPGATGEKVGRGWMPALMAAPGVTHVIVREDPYRVSGDQMALGLLAGAATGAALGSFMWMPCWF